MASLEPMLQIRIESKCYPAVAGAPAREVIARLDLDLVRGEFVCVLGPSGCGKTSLLNLVAGLDRDFSGSIRLSDGQSGRPPRIAYVFQNPRLLPWRTVDQNLRLAVESAGVDGGRIPELLRIMGVSDTLSMYPGHLSTGMQRRVALVRAFAVEPDLLLMDEPLVSLDRDNAQRIRDLLLATWRRSQSTVLFVTHDVNEAIFLADRIVELTASPTRVARILPVTLERQCRSADERIDAFRRLHFCGPVAKFEPAD